MLDEFQKKNTKARIENITNNITHCFLDKKYITPKNWGEIDGKRKIVLAYTVENGPLVRKFQPNKIGGFVQEGEKYIIREPDVDFKIMSCLCIKPIRNTTFHEVYEVVKAEGLKKIFGFTKYALENINEHMSDFDPAKDALFMFAGDVQAVTKRLRLHQIWLKQILEYGKNALYAMDKEEEILMRYLLPKKAFESIDEQKKLSYMYGKPHHTQESEEFLSRKINIFNKYAEKTTKS